MLDLFVGRRVNVSVHGFKGSGFRGSRFKIENIKDTKFSFRRLVFQIEVNMESACEFTVKNESPSHFKKVTWQEIISQ